jgi:hypothetical protein
MIEIAAGSVSGKVSPDGGAIGVAVLTDFFEDGG